MKKEKRNQKFSFYGFGRGYTYISTQAQHTVFVLTDIPAEKQHW